MKYYTIYQKVNCLLNTCFIACTRVVIITLKISFRALLKHINHVTQFLSKNLLAYLHDETSLFCLFKVAWDGWHRMKYFSHKHKLHLFELLL